MDINAIPTFPGLMRSGRYVPFNPDRTRDYMATAFKEGQPVQMAIWAEGQVRSLPQNSYYWGVVIKILGLHLGYDPKDPFDRNSLHDALRGLFLMDYTKPLPAPKSTTELTTIEFSEYLENVWRFASTEHNCFIPDPNGNYVKKPPPFKKLEWK
jgi:hypothetical protein